MERMKKIVVSTGAGISAESGISTFRDAGGLWENYPVMDVASAEGFARNPALVHEFYNARRRDLVTKEPNQAHKLLHEMEKDFDVQVITQNVDNLHEQAGSTKVLHLHGELMKIRSMRREDRVYDVRDVTGGSLETNLDTRDQYGDPVRPHIVFFNEAVPNISKAIQMAQEADVLVVIGTSLAVYPAASLITCARPGTPVYYIDPNPAQVHLAGLTVIKEKASVGVAKLAEILREKYL